MRHNRNQIALRFAPVTAILLAFTVGLTSPATATEGGGWRAFARGLLKGGADDAATTDAISALDADTALRQALELGAAAAAARLGAEDGFFGDPQVRIPLPGALRKTQSAETARPRRPAQ